MTASTKFSFDTTFDTVDQLAVTEAEETLPPEPTFSEAELAEAREQGYAAGFQTASDEARASLDTAAAAALEHIARQLSEMETAVADGLQKTRQTAIRLSGAIARKMLHKTVLDNAQASVEAVITDVLGQILQEPRVVIRVSDEILDPLKQSLPSLTQQSGFPGSIILLAEPSIQIPDCRIEWADGGADYENENLWTEIDGIIERYAMAISAQDADDPPTPDGQLPDHVISEEQANG